MARARRKAVELASVRTTLPRDIALRRSHLLQVARMLGEHLTLRAPSIRLEKLLEVCDLARGLALDANLLLGGVPRRRRSRLRTRRRARRDLLRHLRELRHDLPARFDGALN